MALTMAEAAKLTQDMLVAGVVETVVKESAILKYLPWMTITGSALTYNQEAALASAAFYAVGDTWTESTPTFNQRTATLKVMGGDADVDNFLGRTYADPNDLEATVVAAKAKAPAYAFADAFFSGDSVANPKQFDGLEKLITDASQSLSLGANGGQLTLDKLDELLDTVTPGRPDVIFMSKRTRRKLSSLRRSSGAMLETGVDQFGQHVTYYDGIPVETDDNISDAQTVGTSTNCSSMYAVKFGFQDGLLGIDNGGLQVERLGSLETKDATRTRIKWYVSLVLFRQGAAAKLTGILP
ncbi:MAG: phage major capsid protein [Chloroflexota bacterium]|nr:phage major capsid protein [Chloroflexota bacterium]